MVAIPVSDEAVGEVASREGVCVRPVLRRVTDRATGASQVRAIACGSTREARCPACAARARRLRMTQCREGWHLAEEPDLPTRGRDETDTGNWDHDTDPAAANESDGASVGPGDSAGRRVRSTRRLAGMPPLPRQEEQDRTVGRTFTAPDGTSYRPSMFVTLTLGSYGKVRPGRGVPVDPDRYDYHRAALDALHFARLVDRWVQNLRRCAGYRVQYFSAVEAQRRLAPHLHLALRGAIPRATLKAVTAATYLALWWPPIDTIAYPDRNPVWADGAYRDPDTGFPLTTWDQALAELDADPDARPLHVLTFGRQVDIQGLLAGTPDSARAVRYLTKYLTKDLAHTYTTDDDEDTRDPDYEAHIDRLHHHTRWLPCSPRCANWLRHGIQPHTPGPGLVPGRCPSPAHDRDHLGCGGRRVLVSRGWTGKTLTDHRADRRAVVHAALTAAGITPDDPHRMTTTATTPDGHPRYTWQPVPRATADWATTVLTALLEHRAWRAQYQAAKTLLADTGPPVDTRSATAQPAAQGAA